MGAKLYKLLSMVSSLVGGMIAGVIFKKVWKVAAHEDDAPTSDDEDRRMREILAAAVVQGAIVYVVKALVGRGGAAGVRKVTGTWPA